MAGYISGWLTKLFKIDLIAAEVKCLSTRDFSKSIEHEVKIILFIQKIKFTKRRIIVNVVVVFF